MIKVKKYDNGAILIYQKKKRKHTSVSAAFVLGENRWKYTNPTMHFLEHMFSKDSENFTKDQMREESQKVFSKRNAGTGTYTVDIIFARSNKIIGDCFRLAAEQLLRTKPLEEHVESEKGTILQELQLSKNNPDRTFRFALSNALLKKPYSHTTVLGSEEEINAITADYLTKFRDENFVSQNFAISVLGGISFRKAKKLTQKYFINHLKSNPDYPVCKKVHDPIDKEGNLFLAKSLTNKTEASFKIIIPERKTIEENAKLVKNIGFHLKSQKFYKRLRDLGLIYASQINIFHSEGENIELSFYTTATTENINKIAIELGKYYQEIQKDLLEEEKINTIKKKAEYEADEALARPIYPNTLYRKYFSYPDYIFTKKYKKTLKKEFKKANSQSIHEAVKSFFSDPSKQLYVTIVSPDSDKNFFDYKTMKEIVLNGKIPKEKKTPAKKSESKKTEKPTANSKEKKASKQNVSKKKS